MSAYPAGDTCAKPYGAFVLRRQTNAAKLGAQLPGLRRSRGRPADKQNDRHRQKLPPHCRSHVTCPRSLGCDKRDQCIRHCDVTGVEAGTWPPPLVRGGLALSSGGPVAFGNEHDGKLRPSGESAFGHMARRHRAKPGTTLELKRLHECGSNMVSTRLRPWGMTKSWSSADQRLLGS